MNFKLLVFFGIIALGIFISLFSLTKCGKQNTQSSIISNPPESISTIKDSAKSSISTESAKPHLVSKIAPVTNQPSKSTANQKLSTDVTFQSGTNSSGGVVGEMATQIANGDISGLMDTLVNSGVPENVRNQIKEIVEDPTMQLDPNRPIWEVAKTRDSVRWMLNFVPTKPEVNKPKNVTIDVHKVSNDEYKMSAIGIQAPTKDVANAIANPKNQNFRMDSLTVAQAFTDAVTSGDFVSARKMASPKVTDERIAGLMVALEEGKFQLREERPLIVTFARESVSWVLSRVNSPLQSSEFALALEKGKAWKINGLTFGKVIASLARESDDPYSPIVEDPAGGESLVLYFDFDSDGLNRRADSQLKIVASILKQDAGRKIRITGHADALGDESYNAQLSRRRADAIRQGIINRGALPSQVITEGYGETKPRKPNFNEDGTDNPKGRSLNRRAEVYLDF